MINTQLNIEVCTVNPSNKRSWMELCQTKRMSEFPEPNLKVAGERAFQEEGTPE